MGLMKRAPGSRFARNGLPREILAGVSVVAATVAAPVADAAVVYSGIVNLQVQSQPGKGGLVYPGFDLPDDQSVTIRFDEADGKTAFGAYAQGSSAVRFAGDSALTRLAAGDEVDSGISFIAGPADFFRGGTNGKGGTTSNGEWGYGDTAYFGFSAFDSSTALTYYGWGRFLLGTDLGSSYLIDYAYDDSGASIQAGQTAAAIPEPGTALLVLLGGAVAVWSRRPRRT